MSNEKSPPVILDEHEHRSRLMGGADILDPTTTYHELLAQCPVHKGSLGDHFGVPAPSYDQMYPAREHYTSFGYESTERVPDGSRVKSAFELESIRVEHIPLRQWALPDSGSDSPRP